MAELWTKIDSWDIVAALVLLVSLFVLLNIMLRKNLALDAEVVSKLRNRALGGLVAGAAYLGIKFLA